MNLISIGSIGLIKGINSFNLEKGAKDYLHMFQDVLIMKY